MSTIRPSGAGSGLQVGGFSIVLTPGGYLLAALAVLAGALALPAAAPGWGVAAYLAATAGLVIGFLASLTGHELAHAALARRYADASAISRQIRIGFFGGSRHGGYEFRTPRGELRVAAAGPTVSLLIAAVTGGAAAGLAALETGRLAMYAFAALATLNGFLAVMNLLPAAGLDGGRMVHALAWARRGDRAAASLTAARIGQFTGALLTAGGVILLMLGYFGGIWVGLAGLTMVGASRVQAREALTVTALAGLTVRDIVLPARPPVAGWQTVQQFLDSQLTPNEAAGGATAFAVHDWDGRAAGLLTLGQLAMVPAGQRDIRRLSEVATPATQVVTTTMDEPLSQLLRRLAVRPASPAAVHTAGHALVLGDDGTPAGLLTPADFARASQVGRLRTPQPTR